MVEWPGTQVTPPAQTQWPGTPNQAVAQRWPGAPVQAASGGEATPTTGVSSQASPAAVVKPQGRGLWQAIKDYPAHVLEGITSLPKRAIEASTEDVQHIGEPGRKELQSTGPAIETALMTMGTAGKFMRGKPGTMAKDLETLRQQIPNAPRPNVASQASPASKAPPTGYQLHKVSDEAVPETVYEARASGKPTVIISARIEGDHAHVEDVLIKGGKRREDANKLGPRVVSELLKKFREQHPEVKTIGGDRISGARQGGQTNFNAGQPVTLNLSSRSGGAPPGGAPATQVTALQAARNAAGTIEKIFSPETVDANAKNAVGIIREASGKAARDTETTGAALEPAYKKVSAMPDTDRLDFLSYVEGRSTRFAGLQMRDPALQDLADTMRGAFEQRMRKLQAMPTHAQQGFIEDYFPHFWKDPNAAQQAASSGGMSRQGSGASLKARSVPTIADGIAAGLEPVTTNPLEATMRYVTSMDRFIAATDVLETAKNAGTVRYIKPQVMGASGHPNSFKVPPGYTKLEGRGSTDAAGGQAYAPDGFARVYNNWISRGFADIDPAIGDAYEGMRRASNSITGLELGLSGYHTLTMAQESMVNSVANAVGYARAGKPVAAAKSLAETPVAPISYAVKGKKIQDIYLGLSQGTQHMRDVTELLTAAGGRAKGASHSPDYEFSKTGSYWTAFKRGALKGQMIADRAEMMGSPLGAAKVGFRHIGRVLDTVAQPIFQAYIPKIKNGAFYENMSAWLKEHPTATREEQVAAARQVWDSVDNRFGELVQDNIFMNKVIKQVGTLSLRSWSWTVGSGRELGGAARDVARAPFKRPTGIGPNDKRWTQKMDYAIALPVVYGTLSAIYQALKTGEPPKDIHDLIAPRTGGADAATGEPERLIMPGYMKDVFGFYEHPVDEMTNKVATAPKMVGQLAENQDWRGDPIFPPDPSVPEWLTAFWNYATQNVGPISGRQLAKGKKAGSNISGVEQMLGVRPAPRYLTDPEGFEQMIKKIKEGKWKRKQSYDRKQQRLYDNE